MEKLGARQIRLRWRQGAVEGGAGDVAQLEGACLLGLPRRRGCDVPTDLASDVAMDSCSSTSRSWLRRALSASRSAVAMAVTYGSQAAYSASTKGPTGGKGEASCAPCALDSPHPLPTPYLALYLPYISSIMASYAAVCLKSGS